jgi:hypothetical protein
MAKVEIRQPESGSATDAEITVDGVLLKDCERYTISQAAGELPRAEFSIIAVLDKIDANVLLAEEAEVMFIARLLAPYLSRDDGERTWTVARHPIRDEWVLKYHNPKSSPLRARTKSSFAFTPDKLEVDGRELWTGSRATDFTLSAGESPDDA